MIRNLTILEITGREDFVARPSPSYQKIRIRLADDDFIRTFVHYYVFPINNAHSWRNLFVNILSRTPAVMAWHDRKLVTRNSFAANINYTSYICFDDISNR